MSRRTIMITGATSGLGLAMATALANDRYELILTCRDPDKGKAVLKKLQAADPQAMITMVDLDLSAFSSIQACTEVVGRRFTRIDVLFNNAGIYGAAARSTAEGFEITLGVNYLGPYYLTRLLIPLLERGDRAQIISMCSWSALIGAYRDRAGIFEHHPSGYRAYLDSKRMQLMMTVYLAAELKPLGISVNAVHPGVVSSGLWKGQSLIMRILAYKNESRYASPEKAAVCGLYLIENEAMWSQTGKLFKGRGQEIRLSRRFANHRWLASLIRRSDEAIQSALT